MFFLALITNMLTLAERNYLACALRVDTLGEKPRIGLFFETLQRQNFATCDFSGYKQTSGAIYISLGFLILSKYKKNQKHQKIVQSNRLLDKLMY